MPRLEKALFKTYHKTRAKVVLIGHSLGGIYARELACRFPNLVERAILFGSPVKDPLESSNSFLRPLFELAHRRCTNGLNTSGEAHFGLSPDPPRVPETLIYSKTDGLVQWQSCIESGAHVEAIEVPSSHCGLPFRPEVLEIVADRLARRSERSGFARAQRRHAEVSSVRSTSPRSQSSQTLAGPSCLMPFLVWLSVFADLLRFLVLSLRSQSSPAAENLILR
jgi:pimeloyl-ACP methyl ester carboxylesterase